MTYVYRISSIGLLYPSFPFPHFHFSPLIPSLPIASSSSTSFLFLFSSVPFHSRSSGGRATSGRGPGVLLVYYPGHFFYIWCAIWCNWQQNYTSPVSTFVNKFPPVCQCTMNWDEVDWTTCLGNIGHNSHKFFFPFRSGTDPCRYSFCCSWSCCSSCCWRTLFKA